MNPDLLTGWGVRPVDWQWGINLQQELAPRVSLEVGYNRRWWGNYTVTDNTLVGPADYEKWTIVAPTDPRLPGGGGYPIDVYTLTAAAAARGADNYVTFETDYGPARTHFWHGVDITLNARTSQGLNLQAGTTTGRATIDTCASVVNIDSPDPRNCRSGRSLRDDVPRLGVVHRPEGERADQRHAALAAGDAAHRAPPTRPTPAPPRPGRRRAART